MSTPTTTANPSPPPAGPRPGRRRAVVAAVVGIAVLTAVAFVGYAVGRAADDPPTRQEQVADRGATVMPFDLDRTTHTFTKTGSGGVETVVALDPSDEAQIDLVRGHLREEADQFRRGDFSDPARIHGSDMPGLLALTAGADRVTFTYADVPAGGRITYAAADPALTSALHDWFDAQSSDHGVHS